MTKSGGELRLVDSPDAPKLVVLVSHALGTLSVSASQRPHHAM